MVKTEKYPPPAPSAVGFRLWIEDAVNDGFQREDMALRLTLRDSSALRRDPSLPLEDISYAGGTMRYLGVEVIAGGVERSSLDRAPDRTPAPPPAPVKKKPAKPKIRK
jgi:hypothetical protein